VPLRLQNRHGSCNFVESAREFAPGSEKSGPNANFIAGMADL
jgi:hypothetical protein